MLNKIRFKLTITNSAVLVSILFVFSIFVYVNVNLNVISTTDNELINAAYQIKRYLPIVELKKRDDQALMDEYAIFADKMSSSSIAYSVWDDKGSMIYFKSNFKTSSDALRAMRESVFSTDSLADKVYSEADGRYYIHTYNYEGINMRVCTTVYTQESGDIRLIQTISNMNEKNSISDRLLNSLIIACLLGGGASFAIGYFIAGRSIIPIQESIQSQKEFIADASHELRTPITIIRTNLDVVMDSKDESVRSQEIWINNAYEETQRMEKMIADLLFLAKADLKQEVLQLRPVAIHTVCFNTVQKLKPVAAEKDVGISYMPGQDEIYAYGDRGKIEQLLVILLDNAIHYSKNRGTVTLTTGKYKNFAQIVVQDTGIGIAKEDIENIFKRFYRTDKARSRRAGGTGLGLSIAKWIVDAHKGEISAESQKGRGTKITVLLPLKEGDKA